MLDNNDTTAKPPIDAETLLRQLAAMLADAAGPRPDALLRRTEAAIALTRRGLKISENAVRTAACRGYGPPFQHYGSVIVYRWSEVLAWAEAKLSPAYRVTAEANPQRSQIGRQNISKRHDRIAKAKAAAAAALADETAPEKLTTVT